MQVPGQQLAEIFPSARVSEVQRGVQQQLSSCHHHSTASRHHVANVAGEKSYVMLNSSGVSVTMDTGTNTTLTPEVGVTLAMKNVFKVAKNFLQIILSDKGKNT